LELGGRRGGNGQVRAELDFPFADKRRIVFRIVRPVVPCAVQLEVVFQVVLDAA
jgi:hypothetical protein